MCNIIINKNNWELSNSKFEFNFEVIIKGLKLDGRKESIGFSQYIYNHVININGKEFKTEKDVFYLDTKRPDFLYAGLPMPSTVAVVNSFSDNPYWNLEGIQKFQYASTFRTYILLFVFTFYR